MNNVKKILLADLRQTGSIATRILLLMLFFFVYFSVLSDNAVNIAMLFIFAQTMFIYMLATKDITQNISTYISMGCTRKNVLIAIVLRWMITLAAAVMMHALVLLLLYPEFFVLRMFVFQITTFLLVLGINFIAVVVGSYNRMFGVLIGCIVAMLIGCVTFFLVEYSQSADTWLFAIADLSGGVVTAGSMVSLVVLLVGFAIFSMHLRKYSV